MDPTSDHRGKTSGSGAGTGHHPKPSKSELMSSSKLVADALRHDPNKAVDKAKLAGAAADLLNAASDYGKLDGKGIGKFVGKAEDYLHKYETSHSTTTTTTTTTAAGGHSSTTTTHTASTTEYSPSSQHPGANHGNSGGGYGEYIKMAEGMFNKHSGGKPGGHSGQESSGNSGGGYGEYIKMAEGMFNKHSGGNESSGKKHSGDGNGGATTHSAGESGGKAEYLKMAGDFLKKH